MFGQIGVGKRRLHQPPHQRQPARSADEDDVIDVAQLHPGPFAGAGQRLVTAVDGPLDLVANQTLEEPPASPSLPD
ncbi:MAG: hypothetical protein U0736_25870 [Gemmataceae bacterium]